MSRAATRSLYRLSLRGRVSVYVLAYSRRDAWRRYRNGRRA